MELGVLSQDSEPWVLIPGRHRLARDLGQGLPCLWPPISPSFLDPEGKGSKCPSRRDIAAFHSPDAADFPALLLDVGVGSITLPSQVCELGRLQSSIRIPTGAELDHLSRAG